MKREVKRREEKREDERREEIVPLSSNVQNLTVFFSIIFMIRIRFFGLRESFQKGVSGGTVSLRTRKLDDRVVSRDRSFREI